MKNIMTVDLEDWFSVETFNRVFATDNWDRLQSVVEPTTHKILDLFAANRIKATFFVLGWVAMKHPALVAAIANAGHEIACHSFYHRMVSSLTPDEFRKDTKMAFDAIVSACGRIPVGYRSPTWGIKQDMNWAFDILGELGFQYDSSIFPIRHDLYGDPAAPREAFEIRLKSGKTLLEVPASTLLFLGRRVPLGGGGWLRQFPYWYTRRGIRSLNKEGLPVMVYFHPWELEPGIPRVRLSLKNHIRQYGNLNTMEVKVKKLIGDFDFVTVSEYINTLYSMEKTAEA